VGDEIDYDCDGTELCYRDDDDDGYGDATTLVSTGDIDCQDALESTLDTDCDDTNIDEYPGQTWYADPDLDGYGTG